MTKEDKGKVLAFLRLGRNYVIDVLAAGVVKAEYLTAESVGNNVQASELLKVQNELHTRIQNAEAELVSEIAKNVE